MPGKQESLPIGGGREGASEPEDHVADASDVGSAAFTLSDENRRRPDPPQPPPRDYGGDDEQVGRAHPLGAEPQTAEAEAGSHDATGGEAWNRALGGNTSAGTLRLLAAVGVFIVISALVFWLAAG